MCFSLNQHYMFTVGCTEVTCFSLQPNQPVQTFENPLMIDYKGERGHWSNHFRHRATIECALDGVYVLSSSTALGHGDLRLGSRQRCRRHWRRALRRKLRAWDGFISRVRLILVQVQTPMWVIFWPMLSKMAKSQLRT